MPLIPLVGAVDAFVNLVDPPNWFPPQSALPLYLPQGGGWRRTHGPYPFYEAANGRLLRARPLELSGQDYPGPIVRQWISVHTGPIPANWLSFGIWWQGYVPQWPEFTEASNYERWERDKPGEFDEVPDYSFPGRQGRPALPSGLVTPSIPLPSPSGNRYRVPEPDLSPHEQDQWGSELPSGEPWVLPPYGFPAGLPYPVDPVVPSPGSHPGDTVSVETEWNVSPSGSTVLAPRQSVHSRSRPPRGTKERKLRAADNLLYRLLTGAYGAFTEASDFVDALWDALPKNRKGGFWLKKGAGPGGSDKWVPRANKFERARLVYQYFDEIDVREALKNLASDQLKDAAIGKAGKLTQQQLNKAGWQSVVGHSFRGWRGFG